MLSVISGVGCCLQQPVVLIWFDPKSEVHLYCTEREIRSSWLFMHDVGNTVVRYLRHTWIWTLDPDTLHQEFWQTGKCITYFYLYLIIISTIEVRMGLKVSNNFLCSTWYEFIIFYFTREIWWILHIIASGAKKYILKIWNNRGC